MSQWAFVLFIEKLLEGMENDSTLVCWLTILAKWPSWDNGYPGILAILEWYHPWHIMVKNLHFCLMFIFKLIVCVCVCVCVCVLCYITCSYVWCYKFCDANLQVVGLHPSHTCVYKMCFSSQSPLGYMFQLLSTQLLIVFFSICCYIGSDNRMLIVATCSLIRMIIKKICPLMRMKNPNLKVYLNQQRIQRQLSMTRLKQSRVTWLMLQQEKIIKNKRFTFNLVEELLKY